MLADLAIAPPPAGLAEAVQRAIDVKTKPPGALGRVESLAVELALAQHSAEPAADPCAALLFAGDHGLVEEGVSAWPQEVTAQMVLNFLSGAPRPAFLRAPRGRSCASSTPGSRARCPSIPRSAGPASAPAPATPPARTRSPLLRWRPRSTSARRRRWRPMRGGACVIALGEMGIGNSSSAALLGAAVTGIPLETLTGPGAGLGQGGLGAKRAALARAQARRPGRLAPADALAAFGGLEIAAMSGALIGAASARAAVLVDGFIATAAATVALAARPEARTACLFAHRSAEPGHAALLAHLGADPLLALEMRLGEGTGALLALPLLRASAAMLQEMASFAEAGVSESASAGPGRAVPDAS